MRRRADRKVLPEVYTDPSNATLEVARFDAGSRWEVLIVRSTGQEDGTRSQWKLVAPFGHGARTVVRDSKAHTISNFCYWSPCEQRRYTKHAKVDVIRWRPRPVTNEARSARSEQTPQAVSKKRKLGPITLGDDEAARTIAIPQTKRAKRPPLMDLENLDSNDSETSFWNPVLRSHRHRTRSIAASEQDIEEPSKSSPDDSAQAPGVDDKSPSRSLRDALITQPDELCDVAERASANDTIELRRAPAERGYAAPASTTSTGSHDLRQDADPSRNGKQTLPIPRIAVTSYQTIAASRTTFSEQFDQSSPRPSTSASPSVSPSSATVEHHFIFGTDNTKARLKIPVSSCETVQYLFRYAKYEGVLRPYAISLIFCREGLEDIGVVRGKNEMYEAKVTELLQSDVKEILVSADEEDLLD